MTIEELAKALAKIRVLEGYKNTDWPSEMVHNHKHGVAGVIAKEKENWQDEQTLKVVKKFVAKVIGEDDPIIIKDAEGYEWKNTIGREKNHLRHEQRKRAGLIK